MSTTIEDIAKSKRGAEKARDYIEENTSSLSEKKARKVFEAPFRELIAELDENIVETLYESAIEENTQNDKILWLSAFNSFAALMELIKIVRTPGETTSSPGSAYADEVLSANSPVAAMYSVFRKNKDLSDSESKALLELTFNTSLIGLSDDARQAVFDFTKDRGVTWFEIAGQYDEIVDIVQVVKKPLYENL